MRTFKTIDTLFDDIRRRIGYLIPKFGGLRCSDVWIYASMIGPCRRPRSEIRIAAAWRDESGVRCLSKGVTAQSATRADVLAT